jgi:glycerol-3-phosphate dehydrogenase subunit C
VLGDPDHAGAIARASFGLANTLNRVGLHRWFMEKLLGVHRDKLLPDFASTTFERWAETGRQDHRRANGAETVLFPTCYVQNNEPQVGRDTLEVLEKNQVGCAASKGSRAAACRPGSTATSRRCARTRATTSIC